jgi:hypothetical protein
MCIKNTQIINRRWVIEERVKKLETVTGCDLSNTNLEILELITDHEDLNQFSNVNQDFFDNLVIVFFAASSINAEVVINKYIYIKNTLLPDVIGCSDFSIFNNVDDNLLLDTLDEYSTICIVPYLKILKEVVNEWYIKV